MDGWSCPDEAFGSAFLLAGRFYRLAGAPRWPARRRCTPPGCRCSPAAGCRCGGWWHCYCYCWPSGRAVRRPGPRRTGTTGSGCRSRTPELNERGWMEGWKPEY